MKKFSDTELQFFEQLLTLNQNQLKKYSYNFLKRFYPKEKIINHKEYIFAEGDIPILLVAHLDTVFSFPPKNIYFDQRKNVVWSPQGLGADDRAGIFAAMQIIRSGLHPHILFTTNEEIGGLGADAFIEDFTKPPAEINYIIQLDRRGSNDCVFYDCHNYQFYDYIESFGFVTNHGSFSDISFICPIWDIAGVNLSVGYYDEHTQQEMLFLGQLYDTINKVKKMLQEKEIPFFKYMGPRKAKSFWNHGWYMTPCDEEDINVVECHVCKKELFEFETYPVKAINNEKTHYYCIDCLTNAPIRWCDRCNEPFGTYNKNDCLCPDCKSLKIWSL